MNDFTKAHFEAAQALTSPGAPFELSDHAVGGVNLKVYKQAAPNLRDLLDDGRQFGDSVFCQYPDQSWTFSQFFNAVDCLSEVLHHDYQIGSGDRVAIAMRNRPEWLVAFSAIIATGATAVPLNSWGKSEELNQGLTDSKARLVFCDPQRLHHIRGAENTTHAIVVDADVASATESPWNAALSSDPRTFSVEIAPDDPAILLFTSGTSGRPKGALFTHLNCCQSISNIEFIGAVTYMTNTDAMNQQLASGVPAKTLLAVPLFHISGLFSQFVVNLRHGRGIYIMYKWDAREALRLIREEGITVMMGAPAMMLDVLTLEDFSEADGSKISNISAGGAATPEVLHALYRDRLTNTLAGAGWGMTETAGSGAAFTGRYMHERPGSSGFPSPIVEFKFCDEDENELPPGEAGEIWIRSSTAVLRYESGHSDDDFREGWLKTGDVGYLSEEGLLYICGRAKDMIIRGGENIYPAEVEACLLALDGVQEAAVVGVPSEHWGEEVATVIRATPDSTLDDEAVKSHCKTHLAGFKVPAHITFTEELLPRNALNKLLKKPISERYFPQ